MRENIFRQLVSPHIVTLLYFELFKYKGLVSHNLKINYRFVLLSI
jgi:hypothetical protein